MWIITDQDHIVYGQVPTTNEVDAVLESFDRDEITRDEPLIVYWIDDETNTA